jgi:hypothetical protein
VAATFDTGFGQASPSNRAPARISEEFYLSAPLYSDPPQALVSLPPPRKPTRARRLGAFALFLALFVPAVVLLALVVNGRYEVLPSASPGLSAE